MPTLRELYSPEYHFSGLSGSNPGALAGMLNPAAIAAAIAAQNWQAGEEERKRPDRESRTALDSYLSSLQDMQNAPEEQVVNRAFRPDWQNLISQFKGYGAGQQDYDAQTASLKKLQGFMNENDPNNELAFQAARQQSGQESRGRLENALLLNQAKTGGRGQSGLAKLASLGSGDTFGADMLARLTQNANDRNSQMTAATGSAAIADKMFGNRFNSNQYEDAISKFNLIGKRDTDYENQDIDYGNRQEAQRVPLSNWERQQSVRSTNNELNNQRYTARTGQSDREAGRNQIAYQNAMQGWNSYNNYSNRNRANANWARANQWDQGRDLIGGAGAIALG